LTVRPAWAFTLPHGTVVGGKPLREAELRPPTGADEAYLLEEAAGLSRAERVSELLERCTTRLGDEPATGDAVRSLTAGDREALLLQLRGGAFGDRLPCVIDCPACGERLDLELSVAGLLLPPYAEPSDRYTVALGENGSSREVRFRLPNGYDQEAAGRERDPELGVRTLVERCVESASGEALPAAALEGLSAEMERLDPQAEIVLRLSCPACAEEFSALLDAATMLFGELATRDRLYREVHALALGYHWSERDILDLDLDRRRRYLDLLALSPETGGLR
jgi:hypothetical protein